MAEINAVKKILDSANRQLLAKGNVVAEGIGYKIVNGKRTEELCIVCSVAEKKSIASLAIKDKIPNRLDGIATDVVQTGIIRAQQVSPDPIAHQQRYRPAPSGISIGHKNITAGTLGCLVKRNGETFILSNNHVLANSNAASIGDAILQPGPHDGGNLADDHIANLEKFIEIHFSTTDDNGNTGGGGGSSCPLALAAAKFLNAFASSVGSHARLQAITTQITENLVDAAIAKPLVAADVIAEVLNLGAIAGVASADIDMQIKKSGRTTGFTTGAISQISATVDVQYGPGQVARFTDQLVAGAMSDGGDSGSAVINSDNNLVGLLFAGSTNTTIINRIEHVFDSLELSL